MCVYASNFSLSKFINLKKYDKQYEEEKKKELCEWAREKKEWNFLLFSYNKYLILK